MLIELDKHTGVPIFKQMVDQIKQQILAKQIKVGEQLTSVRSLAANLQVNPMTVSKAYGVLELEGFVERKRGVGLFVAEVAAPELKERQEELLSQDLKRLAVKALQLGISTEETVKIIKKIFKELEK